MPHGRTNIFETGNVIGNPVKSPVVLKTPPAISEDSIQTDRRKSSAIELAVSDVPKQSILAEDGASIFRRPGLGLSRLLSKAFSPKFSYSGR